MNGTVTPPLTPTPPPPSFPAFRLAMVASVNCANRLYKGWARAEPVDEIRHEDHADSLFKLD